MKSVLTSVFIIYKGGDEMPKFPYKQMGVSIDREFRNDLNETLKDIESDIKELNGAQLGALEAANEAETQALYAEEQGNFAEEKGTYAGEQGDFAKAQATYSKEQGDYSKSQGDYAKQIGDNVKTQWLTAVNTYSNIATTYPSPKFGDTVQTIDDSKIYRYENGQWKFTQQYSANALTDVQNKIGDLSQNKADKIYLDTQLSYIGNASPKSAYATLTALQTDFPTGATGIFVVQEDGKWYYWNSSSWVAGGTYQSTGIAEDSISPRMAKFLTKSTNLFNRNKVTDGLLDHTTGNITASTNDVVTDFIEASPNLYYGSYPSGQFSFYDKNKVFISGVTNTNFSTNRKAPANAAFIRFGLTKTNFNWVGANGEKTQLNSSPATFPSTPAYEDYYIKFGDLTLKSENIPQDVMAYISANLSASSISPEKTNFMEINTSAIKLDSLLTKGSLDYTTGTVSASTTDYASSRIDLTKFLNKFVVSSVPASATVFDKNGAVLSTFANLNGVASRKIVSNASYMILGITGANYNGALTLNPGTIIKFFDAAQTGITLVPYEDPTPKLKNVLVPYNALANTPIDINKINLSAYDYLKALFVNGIACGDSITEGARETTNDAFRAKSYPVYLSRMSGWNVTNGGESGATTLRWWQVDYPKFNFADYDFAIIKLGQNSGLTDTLAADTASTPYADTNTGAYCKIIEGMKAQNPKIKIFLCSIENVNDAISNGVIQQIAAKYNLPYLDLANNGLFNIMSNEYHLNGANQTHGVHYNTIGYVTLAKVIYMSIMKWINSNYSTFRDY
ncbi:SGNH/GDSL hydrolase family protein [Peribacillus sp. SCS-26]|uniref:SGNH/GDSL hydrolase family protein n=1 Tax=Paraperibacillus marinus TaxID=3115295 RepID=UPI003905E69D